MIVLSRLLRSTAALAVVLSAAACATPSGDAGSGAAAASAVRPGETAQDLVRASLATLGDAADLQRRPVVAFDADIRTNLIEQSERPDGPYIATETSGSGLIDQTDGRAFFTGARILPSLDNSPMGSALDQRHADGVTLLRPAAAGDPPWNAVPRQYGRPVSFLAAYLPQALLDRALAAPDLERGAPVEKYGRTYASVTFTDDGAHTRLWIDPRSSALTGFDVDVAEPANPMHAAWADIRVEGEFAFWWRDESGRQFPRRLSVAANGAPWMNIDFTSVAYRASAEAEAELAWPDGAPTEAPAVRSADDFPITEAGEEIASGVLTYSGGWNVTAVDQGDGVVILEAPVSRGLMRRVLDQVARDFPGKPVKAAVSTSDAWPHIGGAPEVMARGIPVYHLDANGPILERLAQANGVEGELRPVSDAVTIDGDRNDIVLFPLGGLGSERMMAARIADAGLLYGSDTLQLDETGAPLSHARLYAYDLVKYSCERGLGTQRAFAMHAEPAAYAAIAEAVGYGSVEDCGG